MPRSHREFSLDLDHPRNLLSFPDKPGRGAHPTATVPDGCVEVPPADPHSVYWRGHVGSFIAEQLGHDLLKTGAWHVSAWPKGYKMCKKDRQPSSKGPRADYYLYGYKGKTAFASPQEFAFHAMWLYDDNYHQNGQCECLRCTGRLQGEINKAWQKEGSPFAARRSVRGSRGGAGGAGGGRGNDRERGGGPVAIDDYDVAYAELPHQPKSAHWVRHKELFEGLRAVGPASPEREEDLQVHPRASPFPERVLDLNTQCPFRKNELVWVSVPRIGSPETDSTDYIELWPATIRDAKGKEYVVRLLGVGTTHVVPAGKILSWQCIPLIQFPQLRDEWQSAAEGSRHVTPLIRSTRPWDNNVVGAFAAAIVAAITIGRHNCLILDDQGSCQGFWWGPEIIWIGDMVQIIPDEDDVCLKRYIDEQGLNREGVHLYGRITAITPKPDGRRAEARVWARIYTLDQAEHDEGADMDGLDYPSPKTPRGYNFHLVSKETDTRVGIYSIAGRYDGLPLTSTNHNGLVRQIETGNFLRTVGNICGYDEEEVEWLLGEVKSILAKELRLGAWVDDKTSWNLREEMLSEADQRSREWLEGRQADHQNGEGDLEAK